MLTEIFLIKFAHQNFKTIKIMNRKLLTRTAIIIAVICGAILMGCDEYRSEMSAVLILFAIFATMYYIAYKNLKTMSEDEINKTLCLNFLKKIGCDFTEE